jgi:hypothetical protein
VVVNFIDYSEKTYYFTIKVDNVQIVLIPTTITRQFISIGVENTVDINNPLLSKYCCLENNLENKNNPLLLLGK